MNGQEFMEMIEFYLKNNYACYDEKEEVIMIVNEIIESIKDNNQREALIRNLESAVNDYSQGQNKCPNCGSDLVQFPTDKHADGFEHEFGTEIFSIWGCQFCDNVVK